MSGSAKGQMRAPAQGLWMALGLAAALSFGAASDAEAQRREGQFIAVGLGGGVDQISCEVCRGTPEPGLSGFVRFGGTISDRLLLGAEFDLWTRGSDGIRQFMGSLMGVATVYADAEAPFHFRLGAGFVGYRASEDGNALTSLAPGASAGIGYDYPITETLSLTPFANLMIAPYSSLKSDGDLAVRGATLALLQGGLSLTWH